MINLITCSSQKPISRRRSATSSEVQSCLIRTGMPARILLKGQVVGAAHRVSFKKAAFDSGAGRIFMSRQSPLAGLLTTPLLSKTRHLLLTRCEELMEGELIADGAADDFAVINHEDPQPSTLENLSLTTSAAKIPAFLVSAVAAAFHLALSALNLKSGRHAICDL